MPPFLKYFLVAGVVTGVFSILFVNLPAANTPTASVSPAEPDQLSDQIDRPEAVGRDTGTRTLGTSMPAVAPAASETYEFKSGLSLEERQALREQLRGLRPNLRFDGGAASESVAVNESYPDGISNPVIHTGGSTGADR